MAEMVLRQPMGATGKVIEKSSAVVDWARSGLAALKAKINKMKAELAVVDAIKEVRDEFVQGLLSGLSDADKQALAEDKEFQRELASLTRESDKELNQSTELYELVSKIGAVAVKTMLGIGGAALGAITGGVATGAIIGGLGDLGVMAANGNRASTANFEFNAGDKVNDGLADEISLIQTVMSKLKEVIPDIVAKVENGKFSKDQIKGMVAEEVQKIVDEVRKAKQEEVEKKAAKKKEENKAAMEEGKKAELDSQATEQIM